MNAQRMSLPSVSSFIRISGGRPDDDFPPTLDHLAFIEVTPAGIRGIGLLALHGDLPYRHPLCSQSNVDWT
jgi:hypothetical protein